MNSAQFRNNPDLRRELLEGLSHNAIQLAIICAKEEFEGIDVPANADMLLSVRALSFRAGFESAFAALLKLTQPNEGQSTPKSESFGTPYTVDDLDRPAEAPKQPAALEPHQIND